MNSRVHSHSATERGLWASMEVGTKLKISIWLTAAFIVFELFMGWRAQSLALISDAGHNFTDLLALVLSWVAVYVAKKSPTESKTFGYHRAGVLAAFVNAITLLAVAVYIFYEAYQRVVNPTPVRGRLIIVAAATGFIINTGISGLLLREGRKDVNIRSALVHMMGDALATLGIVISGIAILLTGRSRIDPLISMALGVLIVWSSGSIVRETLNILLEGLPQHMTLEDVYAAVKSIPGVRDVHHLHIWSLTSHMHALSGHICIDDIPPSQSNLILKEVNDLLAQRFSITHTTIQFEHLLCQPQQNACAPSPSVRPG